MCFFPVLGWGWRRLAWHAGPDARQGRFFVFGENDEVLGERIVMAVESDHQYTDQLNEVIQTILDKYEQPKHIYFLAKFVETLSGKINRIKTIELIHG